MASDDDETSDLGDVAGLLDLGHLEAPRRMTLAERLAARGRSIEDVPTSEERL